MSLPRLEVELPFLNGDDRGRARVHLAILKLAGGDVARVREALAVAKTDARNALVFAALADTNGRSCFGRPAGAFPRRLASGAPLRGRCGCVDPLLAVTDETADGRLISWLRPHGLARKAAKPGTRKICLFSRVPRCVTANGALNSASLPVA